MDARNIRGQLAEPREDGAVNEAQQQIAYADIILLNKVLLRAISCLVAYLTGSIGQNQASRTERVCCHPAEQGARAYSFLLSCSLGLINWL